MKKIPEFSWRVLPVESLNAADLKVGDAAPDFALQGSSTAKHTSLPEFRGKQAVVIAWYPKAFTGG